jgi:hypothetical protein
LDIVEGHDGLDVTAQAKPTEFFQKFQHRSARTSVKNAPARFSKKPAHAIVVVLWGEKPVNGFLFRRGALNANQQRSSSRVCGADQIAERFRGLRSPVHLPH